MSKSKNESELSPRDRWLRENEGHIVTYIPDYDTPPSAETLARLERLKNIRDEDIDFSDIPPIDPDANWVRARDLGFAWAQPRPGQRPSRKKDAA